MPQDLAATDVATLRPRRYRAASNLYDLIDQTCRSRRWVFKYRSPVTGKDGNMGLGATDVVNLARVKELALLYRLDPPGDHDPLEEKQATKSTKADLLTFRQVSKLYVSARQDTWRNPKHSAQWPSSVEMYAHPVMGDLPVKSIGTAEIMRVTEGQGLWREKPETGSRVRGPIETVPDHAKARHWRQDDDPARWKGHLENLLPRRNKVNAPVHHTAVPWRELLALWIELASHHDLSALALKFTLLTATRTNEVLGATWVEIDRDNKIWTIAAARMKANRPQRVPLSATAITVQDELAALRQGEFLFPCAKPHTPLSNIAMLELRGLCGMGMTVHGTLGSKFKDWASEHGIPGEVFGMCLGHAIKDKVEAAYRRGDSLEPRRAAMQRWSKSLTTPATDQKVLSMRRRAGG